ncbi:ParB/RepB/Spo0J family partition protein [Actinophytocola sp.]|uniref:ParB/RepB/Spo0J family partition protein n=1 Tax=Actinophytocola sp. TaxID=1872138 RepID=UPI002EDAB46E
MTSAAESLERRVAVAVPVASLLSADSPRLAGEDAEHVRTLAELDGGGPPIIVHRATMRVVDGMHRLRAAVLRGRETIDVHYFDGTERDAFVLAVELNAEHGLPLSHKDRTAAACRVIGTHPHWSDRMIAQLTGLSSKTVAAIRSRADHGADQVTGRIGRDGKVRPLNVAHGRLLAGRLMTERPTASLRQIARESGISLGTVRDVRSRLDRGLDAVPARQRHADEACDWAKVEDPGRSDVDTPTDPRVAARMLQQLKKDPSLRFSEAGRTMLRLLDAHSISSATWSELIDSTPAHCADAVATVARNCAQSWRQFAELMEQRTVSRT